MPRTIHLNCSVAPDERDIVELFDKTYRLRPVTRSIQKKLHAIQASIEQISEESGEEGYDQLADYLADGIDALLEIDGAHRTSAKKLLIAKWEADELTLDQIEGYYAELQKSEVEARPT